MHIADIQHGGCGDLIKDNLLVVGKVLMETYQAKLQWRLPDRPCTVELFMPNILTT